MTEREKNIKAIRTACIAAHPDRVHLMFGIRDVLLASEKVGRNLAIRDNGCFLIYGEHELEEELGWFEMFNDDVQWDLRTDDLALQNDKTLEVIATLLVKNDE